MTVSSTLSEGVNRRSFLGLVRASRSLALSTPDADVIKGITTTKTIFRLVGSASGGCERTMYAQWEFLDTTGSTRSLWFYMPRLNIKKYLVTGED